MPGSGGVQASSFHAKGHLTGIKLHKTPRDGAEHGEGEAEAQGTGGRRTQHHHPGPADDWAAGRGRKGEGAGVQMVEAGTGRKGPLDGGTLGPTGN